MIKLFLLQILFCMFTFILPAYGENYFEQSTVGWGGKTHRTGEFRSGWQADTYKNRSLSSAYDSPLYPQNSTFNDRLTGTPADQFMQDIQRNSLKNLNGLYPDEAETGFGIPPQMRIIPGEEPIQGVPLGNGFYVFVAFSLLYVLLIFRRKRVC